MKTKSLKELIAQSCYIYLIISSFFLWIGSSYSIAAEPESVPQPLPIHGVEGYGGIAATYSSYLTNPAQKGAIFGVPSFGAGTVIAGNGKYLGFATITETLWDRLELGYGFNTLSLAARGKSPQI